MRERNSNSNLRMLKNPNRKTPDEIEHLRSVYEVLTFGQKTVWNLL